MDELSRRIKRTLQAKLRALDEANRRGRNVYIDYKHTRFGFAKSLIVHELFESIVLITAARRLRIPLAYTDLELSIDELLDWLKRKKGIAKDDHFKFSRLEEELILDFSRFGGILKPLLLEGRIGEAELYIRIPESLLDAFRVILGLHLSLLEQPTVLSYLEAVHTVPRQTWNELISITPEPMDVARAADTEEFNSASVFSGFLFLASTMAKLNTAFGATPTTEEAADSALLLEYVRGALDWRLDFKIQESFSRFEEIKNRISKATSKEMPYRTAKLFEDEFEGILDQAFQLVPA